ncbi:MAG: DNA recombination protein RmuC [Candidatus Omnitrophota bacterium]|jgi:DNA recombination protein RmuC|nr:MAG: DNA recombination protein RmuC [Candidatus Omnitrophota bacterium]
MIWLIAGILTVGAMAVIALVLMMTQQMSRQLNDITQQVNERLKETSLALQDAHKTVGERLDSATRVFGDVQKSLGRLEETNKQIYEISKDISSLQELLRAPKFRGSMGETLLAQLLQDILPKENIKLQHRFKSGDIVDAAILVGQNLISIDAKFPLENFKKTQEVESEDEKRSILRMFARDVKARIDEVASKYILTDEGTFDFALMYIPSEAVYYQINKDEELGVYAKSRKIIFVSPSTFYAYLQAILYGLRGVSIQRNIQKIFAELGRAQLELAKFAEDFNTVGSHLDKASKKYSEAREKLSGLNERLGAVTQTSQLESQREE